MKCKSGRATEDAGSEESKSSKQTGPLTSLSWQVSRHLGKVREASCRAKDYEKKLQDRQDDFQKKLQEQTDDLEKKHKGLAHRRTS